jgi:hypothetical protein
MSDEEVQRAAVVAEARSWVGTPYHHHAAVKGAGVDCGMLLVETFVRAGLIERFDPRPYPPDWHLHRSEEKYLAFVFEHGRRVDEPRPGDVVIVRYGRTFSHGGIVTSARPLVAVHAFQPYGRVLEEDLATNPEVARRLHDCAFASFWA